MFIHYSKTNGVIKFHELRFGEFFTPFTLSLYPLQIRKLMKMYKNLKL